MSRSTTCYTRDTRNTRWRLVAIFGAVGRSSACMMPAVMAAVRTTTLVINETKGHERVAVSVTTS
eukprot:2203295-Pleurochrysis_carterae.AAC.2